MNGLTVGMLVAFAEAAKPYVVGDPSYHAFAAEEGDLVVTATAELTALRGQWVTLQDDLDRGYEVILGTKDGVDIWLDPIPVSDPEKIGPAVRQAIQARVKSIGFDPASLLPRRVGMD